jgi:hypothetical protein
VNEVRQAFLDAAAAAADLVAHPDVAERWDEPGACLGMTVGGIAAHLVSSGIELELAVVEAPAPEPSGRLLQPGRFFSGQSLDLDNVEHVAIRASSNDAAHIGVERVRARAAAGIAALAERLPQERDERLVLVMGRFTMTLDGFTTTRLVELLAHSDDLATSLDLPYDPPPSALTIALDCLTDVARRRHGDRAVLRTIARGDRTEPVFPIF